MNTDDKTPFKILYEDNHLLAVLKPHGIVTQADEHHHVALDTLMKSFIKRRDNKPGNVFLTPVHRLDKPASGIVIFAKTSKALERMNLMMASRDIEKTYVACLSKPPAKSKDKLIHYLSHEFHKASIAEASKGKIAELNYKTLKKGKYGTWVEIHLVTGRYHQIRAQFAAIGCPIIGDKRYGATQKLKDDAIALIHTKAHFLHPVTKTPLELVHPGIDFQLDEFLDKFLKQSKDHK